MRTFIFYFFSAIICFASCSEDETSSLSQVDDDVITSCSNIDSTSYENWTRSSKKTNKSRSVTNEFTVYGYTSKSSTGNVKYFPSKKLCKLMGIAQQIYIYELVTANYVITVDNLSSKQVRFLSEDSPNCGLFPDYTEDELELRGYSDTQKVNKVTMATKMIHIICDMSGRTYDKWYPCKPDNLEWNYSIWSKE